jgi:CHAT domain-containing protein
MSLGRTFLLVPLAAGLAAAASAQPRSEVFPLGRSNLSGAVCQAVRDYDDDLNRFRGSRAWGVRCQGWEAQLGRIYVLRDAPAEVAWRQDLAARASCAAPSARPIGGLGDAVQQTCRSGGNAHPYIVYAGAGGKGRIVAEGYGELADVLETGARIVAGATPPPEAMSLQTSVASRELAADFGGPLSGLAQAQAAALRDPTRLKARGYVQNNEWRFSDAETDFRALVSESEARNAPPRERAEALLNLALNVSNSGRFGEADELFGQADRYIAASDDSLLRARAFNYHALHARNQQQFDKAVDFAQQALNLRASVRTTAQQPRAADGVQGETIKITALMANELNTRVGAEDLLGGEAVSPQDAMLVQDVQALEIIGSSRAAAGDSAGARKALDDGWARLSARDAQGSINVALAARVQADLASIALAQGRADEAVALDERAIRILRTRHAGTSAEAALLVDLARAQQAKGDTAGALDSYGRAFALFRSQRGYVGASADLSQGYFDLLLVKAAQDPAHAPQYTAQFFDAAETVVSRSTAETVNRLALRVASSDSSSSGLIRALDDARRKLRMAESRTATLQLQGAYAGDARAAADADVAAQQKQVDELQAGLLQSNPRYLQLVAPAASLGELQAALKPGETYLKVLSLRDRTYVAFVTPQQAQAYAVDLPRPQLDAAVQHLRAPFDARKGPAAFDVVAANGLYRILFGPIEGPLGAAHRVIYEPDGALISLPLATFVTAPASPKLRADIKRRADYSQVAWLGADSSLTLSAASFLQSRQLAASRAARPLLAFGDPQLPRGEARAYRDVIAPPGERSASLERVCGRTRQALLSVPPLPETAQEVQNVAQALNASPDAVVVGAAFTDSAVKGRNDLDQYRILYFATHALLPQPDACLPEPALLTSLGGSDSDAMLLTSQILQLKLDADLVVLSACNTGGTGSEDAAQTGLTGGGEALGGLARAMIYAGARGLIVSHWNVDSVATTQLMSDLFRARAESQDDALRIAQQAMQRTAQYSHPYYWAAFTIVGDGARPAPGTTTKVASRF